MVHTFTFQEMVGKLDAHFKNQNMMVTRFELGSRLLVVEVLLDKNQLGTLDSFLRNNGSMTFKEISLEFTQANIKDLEYSIEKYRNQIEALKVALESLGKDSSTSAKLKAIDIRENITSLKNLISERELSLKDYQNGKNMVLAKIKLADAETAYNSKFTNVRMPGVEYSMLFQANPTKGINKAQYEGLSMRYIFTNGKDYFSLSAYRATSEITDSTTFDQFFCFTFAQDFYSRKYGSGRRTLLNPYVGYTAGINLANNKMGMKAIPVVAPTLGLELFKNKWVMLDVHAHYQLPMTIHFNEMRGWMVNGGINLAF